ncbi:MAG: DUF2497 domain-containing protein [Alphaproteobacteria bacterium]
MDEILATIRRIIAEDERSSSAAEPGVSADAGRAAPEAPGDANDVLDLTDVLSEDGGVQPLKPVPNAPAPPEPGSAPAPSEPGFVAAMPPGMNPSPGRRTSDEAKAEDVGASDVEPSAPAAQPPGADDRRLVSDVAALAAATAFGRLASAPRTRREPPSVGGRPLDDIVRELLRPLLQTWLDENLPGIVERLVEAEIARISSRSGPG